MSLNSFGNKLRTGPLGAILFVIVVLCVGVLAFTGLGAYVNNRNKDVAPPKVASDILATVDKTPISVAQFQNALDRVKQQYAAYGQPPSVLSSAQVRYGAFSQLESPIFMAALAKQHKLTVTSADIDKEHNKQLDGLKKELGLPTSSSESDVESALAANQHTVADFINDDDINTELLAKKYQDYLIQSNQATENTVQAYYSEVHTRHILISTQKHPPAQALALATDLISRINKGATFASLVKPYSDDPGTVNKGGDDGFISQATQYVPEFKNAALALKAGQVTQTPVYSPQYGYFIIQAVAVKSNLPKDYQKNHQGYVSQVTQQLAQQQGETEMAAAKAKATVNVLDSRLKGDVTLAESQTGGVSPEAALADYDKALKNGDESDKAEIYATEALIYQELNQSDKEKAALQSALADVEDPQLNLMLGDIYKRTGDSANALTQYNLADQNSFDDPSIHLQLQQDYKALKKTVLAAKEADWMKQYTARQKQANAGGPPTP
jgi:parvulin-like peptidyl-prolyl isomerase